MTAQEIGGWWFTIGLVVGPGLAAAVLWSPFLLSSRIRALFRTLPPARSAAVSYPAVILGLSAPYVVGTAWAITNAHQGTGGAMATALLNVLFPLTTLYVIGLPIVAVEGLPRLGIDWDPTGYGASTWVLLIVGSAWYSAVFAVPLFLVSLVLALPT